jgi:CubicO group peptidase (beta-lactamase class C family)
MDWLSWMPIPPTYRTHVNSIFEEHPEQKITLRMLLSHTAGFAHEAPFGSNYDHPAYSFEDHIASISDTWLKFPVGTRYAYSNLGIDLAGYILQVRSGTPFVQYAQQTVLDPLGMSGSTLDVNRVRAIPIRHEHPPLDVA